MPTTDLGGVKSAPVVALTFWSCSAAPPDAGSFGAQAHDFDVLKKRIIGGINIVGRLLAGYLGQRYLKNVLLGLTYLGRSAVLMVYFMLPPTPATTIVFAAAMGMMWLGVIPLVSGYVADLFGTRNMATLLGVSFVIHQMGSVIGAWGGGMIFDMFGNYDLAWRFGVSIGIVAGIVRILFGGPSGTRSGARPVPAAG